LPPVVLPGLEGTQPVLPSHLFPLPSVRFASPTTALKTGWPARLRLRLVKKSPAGP
jgi:hypothetical protein